MFLMRFPFQAEPFYRIFVADARAPRDGKHVDVVGHFDPIPGKYTCLSVYTLSVMRGVRRYPFIVQAKMATSTSLSTSRGLSMVCDSILLLT